MANVHQFPVKTIDGAEQTLEQYAGKTLLVVNVASKCGFTPQYRGLEEVYRRNKERGLVVLGFPCDQFGHQEPGDEAEIASFCTTQYDVTFPMFSKVNVNGKDAHPLFVHLKKEATGGSSTSTSMRRARSRSASSTCAPGSARHRSRRSWPTRSWPWTPTGSSV